jgi:hypothetical protein
MLPLKSLKFVLYFLCPGLFAACVTPAVVSYRQVGACNGYTAGNRVVSAGPNQAYVIFKVETVDATKVNGPVTFDPSQLYVQQDTPHFVDSSLLLARDLNLPQATLVSVPAGTQAPINKFAIAVLSTVNADGAVEANQTNYFLLAKPQGSGPGTLMSKTNATQTSWPLTQDCRAINTGTP